MQGPQPKGCGKYTEFQFESSVVGDQFFRACVFVMFHFVYSLQLQCFAAELYNLQKSSGYVFVLSGRHMNRRYRFSRISKKGFWQKQCLVRLSLTNSAISPSWFLVRRSLHQPMVRHFFCHRKWQNENSARMIGA